MEMLIHCSGFHLRARRKASIPQAEAAATRIQSIARGYIQRKKILHCPVCLSMQDATLATSVARCSHQLCPTCAVRCRQAQGCCPICRRPADGCTSTRPTDGSTSHGHGHGERTWRTSNLSPVEFIDFDSLSTHNDFEYEGRAFALISQHFDSLSNFAMGYHLPPSAFFGRPRGDRGVPFSAAVALGWLDGGRPLPRPTDAANPYSSQPSRAEGGGLRKAISLVLATSFQSTRRGSRRSSEGILRTPARGRGAERPRSQSI